MAENRKCSRRCWYASSSSSSCECSCGGKNHGTGELGFTIDAYGSLAICTPVRISSSPNKSYRIHSKPYEYKNATYIDIVLVGSRLFGDLVWNIRLDEIEACQFCKLGKWCLLLGIKRIDPGCEFIPSKFTPSEDFQYERVTR